MNLQYIEENLNKIIQNPDSVMYLKPYDVGRKRALFAIIKEEQGVYKKIQITKEQSKGNFPFEPIRWFYQGPGYFYLKDFIVLNDNWQALNTRNLEGFKYKILEDNKKQIGVFAVFSDGSATFIRRENAKKFEKQNGIKPYIDLLKQYKEQELHHDTYEIIEYYINSEDTFTIPKLQQKTEEHSNDILFKEFPKLKITEKTREEILKHPNLYANCDVRICMGKFYTDEEKQQYLEESLKRPLPGEEGPTLSKRKIPKK